MGRCAGAGPDARVTYVVPSASNSECRELLMLGDSRSAVSTVSAFLRSLAALEAFGSSRRNTRYRPKWSTG